MLLAGEMFELRDASEIVIVGKVDGAHRLVARGVCQVLVLEANRTIWQLAVAVTEVCIQRTGENDVACANFLLDREEIDSHLHMDPAMVEHPSKHLGISIQRHLLKSVGKITIVMIRPGRNPRRHRGGKLRRIETPLFARVAAEEFFVKILPDRVDDDILAGPDLRARLAHPIIKRLNSFFGKLQTINSINRIDIDWNRHKLFADFGEHMVLIRSPVGKLREIFRYTRRIRVKNVRSVWMHQHAVTIQSIVGITADVWSLIDEQHLKAAPG